MLRWIVLVLAACVGRAPAVTLAADEVTTTTVLTGLRGPAGVVIRPGGAPGRYEIFVSESGGGRIVKIRSDEPGKSTEVVTGFPMGGRGGHGSPAGLRFLSRNRLVVGLEDAPRDACVWLFDLADDEVRTAEQVEQRVGLDAGDDEAGDDRVSVYALARTVANDSVPDFLVATSYGSDDQPGLWKVPVRANTLGKPTPFTDTKQPTRPFCVAVSSQGYVVVAHANDGEGSSGSRLWFSNPIDGSKVMELQVDLQHVVGLAYSPQSGNLYAAEFGPPGLDGEHNSGVYRIDNAIQPGEPAGRAVKIADVLRPTSLAFGPDGALYIAAAGRIGTVTGDGGFLVKLTGDL